MDRVILHSDMNSFYASVECLYHPEFQGLPVAVGGNPKNRHGIILAKNQLAREAGVKTGEALWEARAKSPQLIIVEPNFERYLKFSKMARKIYYRYSELVEPFGLDEAWIDVTGSTHIYGSGEAIARKISREIQSELGLTVSIGVSFNKIFAKFGSDYKKPDAITVITRENYQEIVWERGVGELLYVGRSTGKKLMKYGIYTIGDLAKSSMDFLKCQLGKMGVILWDFANGLDNSPVKWFDENYNGNERVIKSIGNSITTPRDIENTKDMKLVMYMLTESVAMRLRETDCYCQTVAIHIRTKELRSFTRQMKLSKPSDLTGEIGEAAILLFNQNYDFSSPVRSLGVRAADLVPNTVPIQLDLFGHEEERIRQGRLDITIDGLRKRYGNHSVRRAVTIGDTMSCMDPKKDHVIYPLRYF
ncbi:DNA polymerase Y family protein [Acetobacterium bakii]|uniref:DNA polymerase IV n=1 Tax=Acetobacterium bakii TaxID=52689 RepID=A0A0L6TZ22_9FIRM|nr:DNA polymerase IV [Acetobacterium bakii]KNZ41514.1 DNA polymerase IV [Acetobacterium bakii]